MAPVSLVDLTTKRGRDLLASWLKNPRVVGVFLAPPCGTASRGRSIKLKRKRNAPEPLRDDNNPNGLKSLSFVNKMKISQANKLYHLTAQGVKYAVQHGMIVCVENPQFSLFWATTFWVSVAKLLRYTIFHSCQYGSNRQKKTMLAHNHKAFNQLSCNIVLLASLLRMLSNSILCKEPIRMLSSWLQRLQAQAPPPLSLAHRSFRDQ